MVTPRQHPLGSVDAGWEEHPGATPAPPDATGASGPAPNPERGSIEETRTIPVEELDALLESAGSGCEGTTASLSAGELDELLEPNPVSGFGRISARPAPQGDAPRTAGLDLDEEVGAAFDAMADPAPSGGEQPGPLTRDSAPTIAQGSFSPAAHPPEAFQAWGPSEEPATMDLQSWMAGEQGQLPPDPEAPPQPWADAPVAPQAFDQPSANAPPMPGLLQAPAAPPAQPVVRPQIRAERTFPGSGMSAGSRAGLIAALAMSGFTILGITAYLVSRSPAPSELPPDTAASSSAVPSAVPADVPTDEVRAEKVPRNEADARAALRRMGEGVRKCARNVIGVLPGTAPAIPASFRLIKDGFYSSLPSDYRSPVYSCTSFRLTEPQPFQIQWQVFKGGTEGMAITWLDANGDGKADRSLGLRARLIKRGEVELDEIEPLEPLPAVAATR